MAINPSWVTTISMVDRSAEGTSWSIPTSDAFSEEGAGNTEFAALLTASAALIDGVRTRYNFTQTYRASNAVNASAGQREQKFLVTYEDQVTLAKYSFELPCRKVSLDPPVGTDEYVITAAPFAAFVTALEAYAKSPDGNIITVTSIRLMGKNT